MATKVYLAFDERMALHKPLPEPLAEGDLSGDDTPSAFENCNRIFAIHKKLLQLQANDIYRRFIEIPCIPAKRETIELCHTPEHYDNMERTMSMSDEELRLMAVPNDLYFCKDTFMAAKLAVGGVVECVNAVTSERRRTNRAIALVRPPGHHAEKDEAMGKSILLPAM